MDEAVEYEVTVDRPNYEKHTAWINNRYLDIEHVDAEGHIMTSFYFDGRLSGDPKKDIPAKDSMNVYHTVYNSINHIIQKRKPKSIEFMASESKYNDNYRRLAHHIAKNHNGRVEYSDPFHTIHFRENEG